MVNNNENKIVDDSEISVTDSIKIDFLMKNFDKIYINNLEN